MPGILLTFAQELWAVLGEMAPFLLFGFFVAGVLYVLISPAAVERHLGGKGLLPVLKASIFGIPLPLCSCGVIPVAASLRRHGASKGATTAFITSTPQTGVDSILVTYSLLGGVFTIFRPLAALVSGTLAGWLVGRDDGNRNGEKGAASAPEGSRDSEDGGRSKMLKALHYGFVTLPRDISRPLLAGLVVAGVISALVPDDYFKDLLGGGIGAMLVMVAVGIPIYVCATASVPVAAALIAKGISPGAALVFLMTGPATNAATVATVWKLMGRRATVVYLGTVALTALAFGLALDHLVAAESLSIAPAMPWMLPPYVKLISAVVLMTVLAAAYIPTGSAKARRRPREGTQSRVLSIGGMHCSHCVTSLTRALEECPGVTSADVDLKGGKAIVHGEGLDVESMCRTVEGLGYSARAADGTERGEN